MDGGGAHSEPSPRATGSFSLYEDDIEALSPSSTSSGARSSISFPWAGVPPSPTPSALFSLEKTVSDYSAGAVRWGRGKFGFFSTLWGYGSSRRLKLVGAWTSLLCLSLLLTHGFLISPSTKHLRLHGDPELISSDETGIYASGFAARGHHIPPKIWQVMFVDPHYDDPDGTGRPAYDFDPERIPNTNSWLARNPDYQYTLVGAEGADRFVRKHFAHDERVRDVLGLRNYGSRSDFMRYLLMLVEGGVYSDTDVTCLKPVDQWIPAEWRQQVRVVLGIEGDSMGKGLIPGMLWDVQFGQWTVAAVPGHRLYRQMVENVLRRVEDLSVLKKTPISQLEMTSIEIMNSTGPALWSETVFHELQTIDPSLKRPLDLTGMKEPRLYGDIMVLPIDGIGTGVEHSGSTHDGTIPDIAIVQHHFRGSWRDQDGVI